MLRSGGAKTDERASRARRPAAMHAKHYDQDLVQTFGVDSWLTDADEQARDSLGQGALPKKEALLSTIESSRGATSLTVKSATDEVVFVLADW